eukprot:gene28016-36897_t
MLKADQVGRLRRGFFFSSISVDGGEILEGSEEIQSLWETSPKIEATINKFTVKDFFQGLHSPSSSSLVGSSASKVFYDEIHGIGQQYLKSANIPHLKDEAWRYTNIRNLFSHSFSNSILSSEDRKEFENKEVNIISDYISTENSETCLLFVDGSYCGTVSSPGEDSQVYVGALSQSQQGGLLSDEMKAEMTYLPDKEELPRNSFASDVVSALNMVHVQDIAVIDIPAGIALNNAVHVVFVNTVDRSGAPLAQPAAAYPRLTVRVGDGSQLRLRHTRITVGRNSRVHHTYLQELSDTSRHLEILSVAILGNSSFDSVVVQSGAAIGRVNTHIDLKEEASNCTLNGVILAGRGQSLDLHSSISHLAPAARSEQSQRNVVGEKGEAIFKGRIRIPKIAQLTSSEQLCRSIMLGEKARVVAMPTLEITADNIECSHGASEARKLLLRGFVFDMLIDSKLDNAANERIINKLEQLSPLEDRSPNKSAQNFISI